MPVLRNLATAKVSTFVVSDNCIVRDFSCLGSCIGPQLADHNLQAADRPLWTRPRAHLKRIGVADSPHCDCNTAEQTVHHVLQDCLLWKVQRRSTDVAAGDVHYLQAVEKRRRIVSATAQFLTALGLTIRPNRTQKKKKIIRAVSFVCSNTSTALTQHLLCRLQKMAAIRGESGFTHRKWAIARLLGTVSPIKTSKRLPVDV